MLSPNTLRTYEWLPILVLRLSIGFMFVSGAIGKLADPAMFAGQFRTSGIPFAETTAPIAAVVELLGGFALALGIGTRIAAAVLAVIMAGALISTIIPAQVHAHPGIWELLSNLFYQAEWLLLGVLALLLCTGGGRASLDTLLRRGLSSR